jgi:glycosidase
VRLCASAAAAAVALLAAGAAAAAGPPLSLGREPVYSALASQRIYFVMPDRYADGDPSNDHLAGDNAADVGFFHGGDLKGLTGDCTGPRGLARIKTLGFTAIWITPVLGQNAVQGDSAAYHGYWPLDFTTVDPHFGTEADFAAFTGCAHRLGLKVILDVIVNDTADVAFPSGGSAYSDLPYRDCRGRVFDAARYPDPFPCLKASTMPRPPVVVASERGIRNPAWLNDLTNYHNRGDVDFASCSEACYRSGDIFGLDDLFTEKPVVVNGLAEVYASWISRFKLDGFRIDAARHVDSRFFRRWLPRIFAAARAAGVPDFQVFGEVFIADAVQQSAYVRDWALPSALDFPFQDAAAGYASGAASARALAARFADDDYVRGPNGVQPTPPTFVGNHDMGRAAYQLVSRAPASGDVLVRRDLLAQALMYLLRGAPVVMYGDEVGMLGSGGDKQARQDMFPTAVKEWQTQERVGSPPIGSGSSFDVVGNPVGEELRALGALRDRVPALSVGSTIVRLAAGPLLAVSRVDRGARREYLAVFNSGTAAAAAIIQTATPSAAWMPLLGGVGAASDGAGRLSVTVPPLSALLLEARADLPARPVVAPKLTAGPDSLSSLYALSATAPTLDPLSVTFAVKRAGGAWQRVAVDDSPPYRGFLEPARFRRKERVQVAALARSSTGAVAVSASVAVVPRP